MTERVKLGDVCTVVSGTTPKSSEPGYWGGVHQWVTPAEINEDTYIVTHTERTLTDAGVDSKHLPLIPAGAVLLTSRAPIGKVAIAGCDMYCNQGFKNLICSDRIDNGYLYRFLKSNTRMLQDAGRGVTFKELSKKDVERIDIPLPDMDGQRRIANRLDEIERLQRIAQDMLDKYDELIQARFVEMFEQGHSYDFVPMSSIGTVQTGATPSRRNREYYNGDIPWIKTNQIKYSTITSTDEHITKKALQNTNCKLLPVGTVLIAMYGQGDTRGRAAIVGVPAATNQASASIVLEEERCNSLFLLVQLKRRYEELRSLSQGGTQKNLSLGIIKEFPVMVPPIEIQNDFAAFVEQVNQMKDATTRTLEQLRMLYDSLAQQYFAI